MTGTSHRVLAVVGLLVAAGVACGGGGGGTGSGGNGGGGGGNGGSGGSGNASGNGTAALEIVEDLPDVDAVVIPWGGGGLTCGIAAALRASKPGCRIYAAEVASAAPLAASLAAGAPQVIDYRPSFVDGIGSKSVFPQMFELARTLIDAALVAGLDEVAAALLLLAERNRVIAEGAGACALACALSGQAGSGKIVCIVSGGNIDLSKLCVLLAETSH